MQEVCLSVSTCIRRSMFFPFRGEVSCTSVCTPVCVIVADRTGRLTSRNPCSKNRHCVFPALARRYHRTHTRTHARIIALFSFPLAGFLNAYPCASGCQDVSQWLSWENLFSGTVAEDANRRGVTASSQCCCFFFSFYSGRIGLLALTRYITSASAPTFQVSHSDATSSPRSPPFSRRGASFSFPFLLLLHISISHHLLGYLFPCPAHPSRGPLSLSEADVRCGRQYWIALEDAP